MDAPCTSGQANKASILAALQEKVMILKQQIIATEQSLDQVPPEDIPQLKTALLQVSKMISQMEAAADYMNVQRLNLKNEIRTYQDENIHLQSALIRERRKSQGKDRGSSLSARWGRGIPPPPPPPPKRENSLIYNSMRSFIFPPTVTRYRPLNENEFSVIDLTFDGTGSSTSSTRAPTNVTSNPGTSGVRRGRGSNRGGRGGGLVGTTGKRSATARRGRGASARARLRPPNRGQSGNDVTDPTSPSTTSGAAPLLLALPPTAPQDNRMSAGQNDTNENANFNNRMNNRNNRFAGRKMFNILNSYPSLD
ncbi:unnamed protein product [Ixodes hexagonus]